MSLKQQLSPNGQTCQIHVTCPKKEQNLPFIYVLSPHKAIICHMYCAYSKKNVIFISPTTKVLMSIISMMPTQNQINITIFWEPTSNSRKFPVLAFQSGLWSLQTQTSCTEGLTVKHFLCHLTANFFIKECFLNSIRVINPVPFENV